MHHGLEGNRGDTSAPSTQRAARSRTGPRPSTTTVIFGNNRDGHSKAAAGRMHPEAGKESSHKAPKGGEGASSCTEGHRLESCSHIFQPSAKDSVNSSSFHLPFSVVIARAHRAAASCFLPKPYQRIFMGRRGVKQKLIT